MQNHKPRKFHTKQTNPKSNSNLQMVTFFLISWPIQTAEENMGCLCTIYGWNHNLSNCLGRAARPQPIKVKVFIAQFTSGKSTIFVSISLCSPQKISLFIEKSELWSVHSCKAWRGEGRQSTETLPCTAAMELR